MKKLLTLDREITNESSFSGYYINVSFRKILDLLGQPTFVGSLDNKTQVEWVFYDKDDKQKVITFYDWRNARPLYQITRWHIGAKNMKRSEILHELKELGFFQDKEIMKEGRAF